MREEPGDDDCESDAERLDDKDVELVIVRVSEMLPVEDIVVLGDVESVELGVSDCDADAL